MRATTSRSRGHGDTRRPRLGLLRYTRGQNRIDGMLDTQPALVIHFDSRSSRRSISPRSPSVKTGAKARATERGRRREVDTCAAIGDAVINDGVGL